MPRKREPIAPIKSDSDCDGYVKFVINYIYRTPSMTSKLPRMVLDRVDHIVDFWRRGRK